MLGRRDISGARNSVRYVTYLIIYQKLGISQFLDRESYLQLVMGDVQPSGF